MLSVVFCILLQNKKKVWLSFLNFTSKLKENQAELKEDQINQQLKYYITIHEYNFLQNIVYDYSYGKEKDLLFIFQFKMVNALMIVNFLNVNTNQREQNDNDEK